MVGVEKRAEKLLSLSALLKLGGLRNMKQNFRDALTWIAFVLLIFSFRQGKTLTGWKNIVLIIGILILLLASFIEIIFPKLLE